MTRKHLIPMIGSITVLAVLVAAGCWRYRTPEDRAENAVQRFAGMLDLNQEQTAKLEAMKQEYLARRPEYVKLRRESIDDLKEMLLSPQIDQERLNARREKIESQTDDMIRFMAARFVELHDLLTPEQRSRLAEKLEKGGWRYHHW
jgi:Spy/CpxP family protein refolding chaperone